MVIKRIDGNKIFVSIPLTRGKDKTRIKKRSNVLEYGELVSTRSERFNDNCYVEWQLGYDLSMRYGEKFERTTLKDVKYSTSSGEKRALYELSEYIWYFFKN